MCLQLKLLALRVLLITVRLEKASETIKSICQWHNGSQIGTGFIFDGFAARNRSWLSGSWPVQSTVGRQGQHRGPLCPPQPQWGAHQRLGLTPARTSQLSPSESSRWFVNNHSQIFSSINLELSTMLLRTEPCSQHLPNTHLFEETLCKAKERWETFSRAKSSPTLSTQIFKLKLFHHFSDLLLHYVIRHVIINQKVWKGWAEKH